MRNARAGTLIARERIRTVGVSLRISDRDVFAECFPELILSGGAGDGPFVSPEPWASVVSSGFGRISGDPLWLVFASCRINDPEGLAAASRRARAEVWGDAGWLPDGDEEALLEVMILSSGERPAGYEIVDMHYGDMPETAPADTVVSLTPGRPEGGAEEAPASP
ncbi:MAG: hypothetical protein DI629_20565 [Mesorhizobium amorphae]|nr:MAG: hypothetical protein DI629_20565 [Mesorhizobium amorphae]